MATKKTVLDRAREAANEHYNRTATLEEIGRLAGGIKQPSVSEWKTGAPRIDNGVAFALATKICVEWLYTGRGPKRPIDLDDMDLKHLLELWPRLPDIARGRILQIADDSAARFRDVAT